MNLSVVRFENLVYTDDIERDFSFNIQLNKYIRIIMRVLSSKNNIM